jgi:hypothetical protein
VIPDDPFAPNPWVMGVVLIGSAAVLWWLAPDEAAHDERVSRLVWGRFSAFRRGPRAARSFHVVTARMGAVMMGLLGVVLLIATACSGPETPAGTGDSRAQASGCSSSIAEVAGSSGASSGSSARLVSPSRSRNSGVVA